MNINKDNYQAYILDYYEGNLSEEQAVGLMSFLEKHPELKAEFDDFEIIKLKDHQDDIKFNEKELIKKPEPEINLPVTAENFEIFCIAEKEGLLNENEINDLKKFAAQNPSIERTRKLYALAQAKPDSRVVFQDKDNLKKQPVMKVAYKSKLKRHQISTTGKKVWYRISAAAVVLIIASIFFTNKLMFDEEVQYAITTTEEEKHTAEPAEKSVEAEKTKPLTAESQTQESIEKPEQEAGTSPASKKDDAKEEVTLKPLETNQLASLPPQQLQQRKETHALLTQQQTKIHPDVGKDFSEDHEVLDHISLPQLALNELQKRSGLDIAPERISFWDIAGQGLAAISRITGKPLTVQKERNEQGNVTCLAIGDNFQISMDRTSAEK